MDDYRIFLHAESETVAIVGKIVKLQRGFITIDRPPTFIIRSNFHNAPRHNANAMITLGGLIMIQNSEANYGPVNIFPRVRVVHTYFAVC